MRPVLIALFLTLFLTACGQTGPLYLPKPEPAAPPAAAPGEPAATEPTADQPAADATTPAATPEGK